MEKSWIVGFLTGFLVFCFHPEQSLWFTVCWTRFEWKVKGQTKDILYHMGLESPLSLKYYKLGHFIVLFLYCSPRPLWAVVLEKCRFLNILPCFRVCRISNYGDSRSLWHDLWWCGCLWSGLSPFIQILSNILWLERQVQLFQNNPTWFHNQTPRTIFQVSFLAQETWPLEIRVTSWVVSYNDMISYNVYFHMIFQNRSS